MQSHPRPFPPLVVELLEPARLLPLGPGTPNEAASRKLRSLRCADLFEGPVHDHEMASACLAGLWLYHDCLEASHTISQQLASPSGSYWHAIMHRREPDYANSQYWFRQVGTHPIFAELCRTAQDLLAAQHHPQATGLIARGEWSPSAFVDLCRTACGRGDELELLCRTIQMREWELLFQYCYKLASK